MLGVWTCILDAWTCIWIHICWIMWLHYLFVCLMHVLVFVGFFCFADIQTATKDRVEVQLNRSRSDSTLLSSSSRSMSTPEATPPSLSPAHSNTPRDEIVTAHSNAPRDEIVTIPVGGPRRLFTVTPSFVHCLPSLKTNHCLWGCMGTASTKITALNPKPKS